MPEQKYFFGNGEDASDNKDFRRVVYTSKHVQVVLMSVPAGEEIGEEVHDEHDQVFIIVAGEGKVAVGEENIPAQSGNVIVIPAGIYHNVHSLGPGDLKLYGFCAPPHHARGTVHPTKASAVPSQEH